MPIPLLSPPLPPSTSSIHLQLYRTAMAYSPPSQEMKKNQKRSFIYSSEFQAMLDGMDEDDCADENGQSSERKRRLSEDQVRKLEKMFEIENKLEADKKQRIAEELGLQPRQVAVWFQNRRARWKTKQLERDYGALQADYEALKLNYSNLETQNQTLISELRELKEKILVVDTAEEHPAAEPNNNNVDAPWSPGGVGGRSQIERLMMGGLRDGLSDSDCSGESLLNSHNVLPSTSSSSSSALLWQGLPYLNQQPPWKSCFQMLAESRGELHHHHHHHHHHQQQQLVKVEEEQNMFDDSVSFFSLDQPPTFY